MRLSVDHPVDRHLSSVDRVQVRVALCQSVDRADRPFLCHGRPGHVCARCAHRSTVRSTGSYPGLLQCVVLLLYLPISMLHSFISSISSLLIILHFSEDFSNLNRTPTNTNISPDEIDTRSRRNRHTISAKSTHDLDLANRRNMFLQTNYQYMYN